MSRYKGKVLVAHRKCIIIRCNDSLSPFLGSWLPILAIATIVVFITSAASAVAFGFIRTFGVISEICGCLLLPIWLLKSSDEVIRAIKLLPSC